MAEAIQHGECIEKIMNAFAQIGHELTNKQAEQFFHGALLSNSEKSFVSMRKSDTDI